MRCSVPGHATQPYRLTAYSLGVPRAMCKQAKEQSRPESVHHVSGSLHGLPGNESPPLARARGGHFVLPAPFQRRQICSSGKISEIAGTHGISFGSMSSGLITHATSAAVAENSSPLDGMDLGTFEYRGHRRLHRSSSSVAQPGSLQPGSPPGVGDFTRGGHNRRIDARLGSGVQGNASFGAVVGAPDPVAHKPLGIGSSLFSSEGVSNTTGTATCTDSHRQHVCSLVHKSPGRHSFQGSVRAGNDFTAMGGFSPSIHQSNAHPRSLESRGGLYALKWGVFVKWCHQAHIDPVTCTVLNVLSFLQNRLDSGSLPSTLKVYVAAIAAFRSPQGGQSIGRDPMVVSFLKGARRLHPPRPPSVPPWDLEVVLRALSQPPFEPLTSVGLKELSLKTTLLLALASAKRIGDLHAFSVDSDCIRFGPGDCSVTLRPRMGYVPKSLSTPFKTQTVSLSALSSESTASREANAQTSVCPVRALRIYIDRSASFRQSDQLFVCYGGCAKGRAVSKQRISHWIVDAITAAYTSQGLECPLHIRGHSTRAIASSWAWSRGMSIQDICVAAGWSSQNTFARFYRLDVQSFASQVLSVSG